MVMWRINQMLTSGAIEAISQFPPIHRDTGFRGAKKELFSTLFITTNFDPLRSCISRTGLNLPNRSDGAICINMGFPLVPCMTI